MKIKHIVGLLLITLLIVNVKCKNESNAAPKIAVKDTQITLAAYMGYRLKNYHWGRARRITHDSLVPIYTDTARGDEKEWRRVTWYEAEVPIQVDSAWNKQYGDPLKDSTGKPNVIVRLLQLPPMYVRDTITDLDSAFRYLERFRVVDTSSIKK
jgi:hypothetical protein